MTSNETLTHIRNYSWSDYKRPRPLATKTKRRPCKGSKGEEMILYAVWIEVDKSEFDYVRETNGRNSWSADSPIKLFDTKETAQEEANKWNTGEVVEYVQNE
tara:strand:- start:176 stop:481 length:306 start_codon:yes stop_codon:yes gene_type:complete